MRFCCIKWCGKNSSTSSNAKDGITFHRNFWDFLIMHVMLINKIFFHYNSSMIHSPSIGFHYAALVLEGIIIMDLFINMLTGFFVEDSKTCIMDLRSIFVHYVSTNLFVHLISAIPLEGLMFLRYGLGVSCSKCKCSLFVATLKILSLITTIRIFQVTSYWNRERKSYKITSFFKLFRIFVMGMVIMLQILMLSDALSIIYILYWKKLDYRSYVIVVLMLRYSSNYDETAMQFFCLELSRMCKSFLLFGYGLHPNETPFDRLSALVSFILAYAFHVWGFLGCYKCFARAVFSEEQFTLIRNGTLIGLRTWQLPGTVHMKAVRYYHSNIAPLTVVERQNSLYEALPPVLSWDIKMSCYKWLVMRLPFFANWPTEVINGIVSLLFEEVYLPEDTVAIACIQSDGLIILESGVLAVYSARQAETGHLIDGDYFGELSLVTDQEVRVSTVLAVTFCRVLFLDKSQFRKLMTNYPELFFDMKRKLKEAYGLLTKQ